MNQPPTGTVTFLFTDIEGSTKHWEQNSDAMRPALARHDGLLRDCIEQNGGFVFKTVGDAFCAAFPTANEALQAALAAQVALNAEPWETEAPLRVRMALHTGSAEERGGDYFGQPLNRVARLMAAGHGGQTLLSDVTQGLVRDALPPGSSLLDLGERRLKDLGRPEQVFQLQHPSLPEAFPPLRSLDNPALPNNLPQQATSFIGREKQVEEVKARLGKTRLLTLTGAGGNGKTRLSLQVAAELLDGDGDGVWLVELATLTDPAFVPQAVAGVLGVKEAAGQPMQRTLVDWLKAKRLLLVLDNCEHLVSACASLAADLLRSCPGVHILASSREPLNVSGEQTYRVPTLTLPDPKKPQTVESVSQFEAVRLFIERAQAVQSSFAVTDANAPAVAQVCWRLDGIPLALELAAARVRSLPVGEINVRLDQRFRLLTGGSRTALPRQQTLRALVDWSYDLLTEAEQTLLRRLSVFAGGWTLAAAEGVCCGDPIEDWEVLDLLTGLVDKSLVTYEEVEGRYRLLESIRQYAADRLGESGEAEAVRGRSASWFLTLAEEAEPKLVGPEQGAWLSRLDAEHDNLRASRSWLEGENNENAEERQADAEAGLHLAGTLWRFWFLRGYLSEGRQWLSRVLAGTAGGTVSEGRAKALNGAGTLAKDQGDYAVARTLYEESLAIRRHLEDPKGISISVSNLGTLTYLQGDYAAARALHSESLAIKRRLGDQSGIATSLASLGLTASAETDYVAAGILHEESLAIRQHLGDQNAIATSLANLGTVAYQKENYTAAQSFFEKSLAIHRKLGNPSGIAASLNNLGDVSCRQGNSMAAQALYEECLNLCRQLRHPRGTAYCLEGLTVVALGQNRPARAAQLIGASTALRESITCPLDSVEQAEHDKQAASACATLGEDAFAIAWAEGKAMTWEQAVEYALSDAP